MPKLPFTIRPKAFTGYVADPSAAPPDKLSAPSVNCLVNENGEVEQRFGYSEVTEIDLGESGKIARSYHLDKYDVTVFALGTKVKYYDWTTKAVYDTGLTLTDGTVTRMNEFEGDVYLTNTTDGERRLVFGRLRGAATAGAVTMNIDYDAAARLERFSKTSGDVIIQGTTEAFSNASTASGNTTVTALTKDYDDDAVFVVVHDVSGVSGIEKASKVFFWKRRHGSFGSLIAGNSDQPNNTIYYGKFAGPTNLEDIIVFDYATGGSTRELVGNYGRVTNVVPVKDYLYQFTESEGYVTAAGDVTISGAGIGTTTPDLRDPDNGCLNEDCAASIGNDEISYLTPGKRAMRIRITAPNGAAVVFPDNNFDKPIRKLLERMDPDQPFPFVVQHKGGRRTIYQVRIVGQYYWMIYDHRINDWQPPQQVLCASSFFERKGVLYATASDDDTVYSIDTSFSDAGNPFTCEAWTGDLDIGDATVKEVNCTGLITQPAEIILQAHVTNISGGRRAGSPKSISGAMFAYTADNSVGAVPVGDGGVEAETQQTARWKATFDVFPSEGYSVQLSAQQSNESGYFRWSSYAIKGFASSNSYTPSK